MMTCGSVLVARYRVAITISIALATASCARVDVPPGTRPSGYETYVEPAACADPTATHAPPTPINYNDIRRTASLQHPELFPRNGQVEILFLWYFIREDGSVADVKLWRPSRSPTVDMIALDAGRRIRWHPARCAGQAIATWYGHPIALGGADR
jgi:outer membrane biosynthesis protein TonB